MAALNRLLSQDARSSAEDASYGTQWKDSVGLASHRYICRVHHSSPQTATLRPSRQTPRLNFPDQFQRWLGQAAA